MNQRIVYAFGELHSDSLYVIYREKLRLNKDETRRRLADQLRVKSRVICDIVRKERIARIFAELGVAKKEKKVEMVSPVEDFIKKYGLDFFEGDIINLDENRDLNYMTAHRKLMKNEDKLRQKLEQQLFVKYRENQLGRMNAQSLTKLIKNNDKEGLYLFTKNWVNQQSEMREQSQKIETFEKKNLLPEQMKREKRWVEEISEKYIYPSLILCGRGHLKFDLEYAPSPEYSSLGKIPEMLESIDYEVKTLFLEKWPEEIRDFMKRTGSRFFVA